VRASFSTRQPSGKRGCEASCAAAHRRSALRTCRRGEGEGGRVARGGGAGLGRGRKSPTPYPTPTLTLTLTLALTSTLALTLAPALRAAHVAGLGHAALAGEIAQVLAYRGVGVGVGVG